MFLYRPSNDTPRLGVDERKNTLRVPGTLKQTLEVLFHTFSRGTKKFAGLCFLVISWSSEVFLALNVWENVVIFTLDITHLQKIAVQQKEVLI
ncbi:hypothetical protein EVAR_23934_1 [Eumeta japonica]|uniref:Uncharacterized protein n=1 Tax=Eumeta variegata TaxID=151549 RepID=A0A4C1V179_EUMVA|nr:hypothetical protein EVAR_23934_1 [Eumeta japonica]